MKSVQSLFSPKFLGVTLALFVCAGVMVRSVYAATPFPLSGDVNGDGVVDVLDLRLVLERFFGGDVFADQNSDAVVNILDYGAVLARLGTVSASPSTSPSATPTATPVASPSPPPSGGSGEWSQHGGYV
jgi:hypothetical protein